MTDERRKNNCALEGCNRIGWTYFCSHCGKWLCKDHELSHGCKASIPDDEQKIKITGKAYMRRR